MARLWSCSDSSRKKPGTSLLTARRIGRIESSQAIKQTSDRDYLRGGTGRFGVDFLSRNTPARQHPFGQMDPRASATLDAFGKFGKSASGIAPKSGEFVFLRKYSFQLRK